MKAYELTYIITTEISSEEAEAKAKEIESAVLNKEGVVLRKINPIAKTLAYPIKKSASGFFGVLEFEMEPERLEEFQTSLTNDEKIARHITVIKKPAGAQKKQRTRVRPVEILEAEIKTENQEQKLEAETKKTEDKAKVELKDIEQKLDELLGE